MTRGTKPESSQAGNSEQCSDVEAVVAERKSKDPVDGPRTSSPISGRLRGVSQGFTSSILPEVCSAAAAGIASTIFAGSPVSKPMNNAGIVANVSHVGKDTNLSSVLSHDTSGVKSKARVPTGAEPFPNGYHFPPSHSYAQSARNGLISTWKYFTTPMGFLVTIYGLNIVAWGGMLFLLLCNAAPAMCYPNCNDINSPRRKWIEWNSQILNALFCISGFGLAPWRFRDLCLLLQFRVGGRILGLRRLAGIHRGWFRLKDSQVLPAELGPHNITYQLDRVHVSSVPFPETKISEAPLTGLRAPATKVWKLDLVIWLMVWNTLFQACLAAFMWGMDRIRRPSWSTGVFVAMACIVAAVGGITMFIEGRAVKIVEGVPVSDEDRERLKKDSEQGIFHYNNLKDTGG